MIKNNLMSRSYKKPIVKDHPKISYWKSIRRVWKQDLKINKDLISEKSIINDYNYCDWKTNYNNLNKYEFREKTIKNSRK